MKASQKVITFLAQKVVEYRNKSLRHEENARKAEPEDEKLAFTIRSRECAAIANETELWITELRMNGL